MLGVGLAVAAVAAVDPDRRDIPLCPLHAMTGLLCPLCGGLRAVNHLAHGHLGAALLLIAFTVARNLPVGAKLRPS
jgi:hypothetical protein